MRVDGETSIGRYKIVERESNFFLSGSLHFNNIVKTNALARFNVEKEI